MKRSTGWSVAVVALLIVIGFAAAAGSGHALRTVIAATAQVTQGGPSAPEATAQSTKEAGTQATPAATRSTGQGGTSIFITAPLPTSGAVGITLGNSDNPVRLQSVIEDSPAGKAGLQAGDQVLAVNGQPVSDRDSLIAVITAAKPGDVLTFTIRRGAAQQDVKVTVSTRQAVYCPLPAPTGKPGKSLAKNPLDDPINWVLEPGQAGNAFLTVENGKLSFQTDSPDTEWGGIATLKTSRVSEFIYSVDVTQSSQSVAGLIFNYRATSGFYILQVLPNGTWTMSTLLPDGSRVGGLSFTDPNLKTADLKDPQTTATNTIKVQVQDQNLYVSFNGKLVCGTSILQFGDPPLQSGQIGVYALVQKGSVGVSLANLTFTDITKPAS